ncbi:MAG: hypothetical protein JOZ32_12160 [Bryobacterales bacterium]|nr:hypothetical protein [Bryobacterales bacterium]
MSILPRQKADWALLTAQFPGWPRQPIGILLADATDTLLVRFRRDWSAIAPADDAAILIGLEADLIARGQEFGGSAVLNWLETSASHAIQIGVRDEIETANAKHSLAELFREHVGHASKSKHAKNQSHRRAQLGLISSRVLSHDSAEANNICSAHLDLN